MDPMTWVYIALLVISLFVAASAAKRTSATPPSLQDFEVPTAEDGRPAVMVFGTVWIDDSNIIGYGDLRTLPIKATGGK